MTPYYDDGKGIQIFLGDCRDVLPTLGPVDHVITDPPYEAEAHRLGRRIKKSENGVTSIIERPLEFGAMDADLRHFVAGEVARVSLRWTLTFTQAEGAYLWDAVLRRAGLTRRRWCVWVKPDGQPQYSGDRPGVGYETIVTMHREGASRWNGGGKTGVFVYGRENDRRPDADRHPTVKPLPLMRELVSLFTDPGEIILDPFMGSGTTLRAAKDLGRRCIGIELEERWAEVAAKRLAQEVLI